MKAQTFIQTGAGSSQQGQVPAPVQIHAHTETDRHTHTHGLMDGDEDTERHQTHNIGLDWRHTPSGCLHQVLKLFLFFIAHPQMCLFIFSHLYWILWCKSLNANSRWKKRLIQTSQYLCFSSAVKPASETVGEFKGRESNLCQWVNCEQHCHLWPRWWWRVEQAVQE